MHANSTLLFERYALPRIQAGQRVLEIGPDGFPSTYERLAADPGLTWHTVDVRPEPLGEPGRLACRLLEAGPGGRVLERERGTLCPRLVEIAAGGKLGRDRLGSLARGGALRGFEHADGWGIAAYAGDGPRVQRAKRIALCARNRLKPAKFRVS